MSISSQTARSTFTLASKPETLTIPWYFLAAGDLKVVRTSAGVDTDATLNTHYTVAGAGNEAGGSVTILNVSFWTVGDTITVHRNGQLVQSADFVANGQFPSAVAEAALDRNAMLIQQLKLELDRSLRLPVTGDTVTAMLKSARASKMLGFDANGGLAFYTPTIPVVPSDLVLEVQNITELKALSVTSLTTGRQCSVLGYTSAGDGGGGVFWYDSASAASDNSGTVIQPNSGSGRWKRVLPSSGFINVRHFGATGDGSTNDITAINLAVAALPATHGTLFFPPGKYKMNSGITSLANKDYLTIRGEGAELNSTHNGNTLVIESTCDQVNIQDLWFTGNNSVRANGIHIRTQADNVNILNCYFQGCSDYGVFVGYDDSVARCKNVTVEACIFEGTKGDGVHVMNAEQVVIADNVFNATGDDAIGIVADVSTDYPTGITVTGNLIYNSGARGIAILECIEATVVGNYVYQTALQGIHLGRANSTTAKNYRIHVAGNKLYYCSTTAGPLGALHLEWCEQCVIQGNHIADTQNGAGIAFLDLTNCVIRDNYLRSCPARGIRADDSTTTNVGATWDSVSIINNVVEYVQANESIYAVPASGKTITTLTVAGNIVSAQTAAGNYIYYDRITTGRVVNNTSLQGRTVGAGGTVSGVTTANNN